MAQGQEATEPTALDLRQNTVNSVASVMERGIYGARADEEIILDALLGIRLVNAENASLRGPVPSTLQVSSNINPGMLDFRFIDIPEQETLALTLLGFLEAPVSIESVRRLETFVRVHLIRHDFPYYMIVTPEQDITDGVITMVVEPSRLEEPVRVVGVEGRSVSHMRSVVGLGPDEPINQANIDSATTLLSRNPYRDVIAVTEAGEVPGTTRVILSVDQQRPWTLTAGVNNTGTEATGRERIDAGFQYGNFLARGDLFSYRLSADPDFDYVMTHTLGSTHYLTPSTDLALSLSHTKSDNSLPAPFFQDGEYLNASGSVNHQLQNGARIRAGVEYKTADSNLLFLDQAVSGNDTRIYQFNLGYAQSRQYERSFLSYDGLFVVSPGGLDSKNTNDAFGGLRTGAEAKYAYLRLSGQFSRALSAGFIFNTELSGQLATANLLFSEQLSGGGLGAVRGFEPNALFGDHGLVLRTSLSYTLTQLGVTPQVFVDYAALGSVERLPQERAFLEIGSIGLGVTANLFSDRISLNAALGYRFEGKELNADPENIGINLSITGRF